MDGLVVRCRTRICKWTRVISSPSGAPYLFITPFFVLFIVFWLAPIVCSLLLGFTEWDGIGRPKFVGIANYLQLVRDPTFVLALRNTFFFVIVYTVIMLALAIPIAIVLNEQLIKLRHVFRTAYFLPVTVALAVTALIFSMVLSRDFGLLNLFLKKIGLHWQPDWLNDVRFAMWSLIITRVWRVTGYYMMFLLAGLQAIDRELYEAAAVDGATNFQCIFRITLPQLAPMILFVLVLSSLWSFQIFEEPWILTRGGPVNSTLTIAQYVYQNGFQYSRFGYASALSYVLTLIMMVISMLQIRLFGHN